MVLIKTVTALKKKQREYTILHSLWMEVKKDVKISTSSQEPRNITVFRA